MPLDNTPTEVFKNSEFTSLTPETKVTRRMFVAGASSGCTRPIIRT